MTAKARPKPRLRVVVVGGGVGGLSAALALSRCGFEPVVVERAPERHEQGAGLSIWVSGMRALYQLGIGEDVLGAGAAIEVQESLSSGGDLLTRAEVGEMARAHGLCPPVAVRRAELLAVLARSVSSVETCHGTCVGFREDGDGVAAMLDDGREVRGAVLVGADGIHSVVRRQLLPAVRARYLGYQSLRGLTREGAAELPPGRFLMLYGRGDRFGVTQVGNGLLWWFAVIVTTEGSRDSSAGRKADLLRRYRGFVPLVPALIESTPETEILRHDVRDIPVLPFWGRGRVTLLGDAAHAASVAGGKGVSEAVTDAVVLSQCMRGTHGQGDEGSVSSALRAYEARRRMAAAGVQVVSRRIGKTISWRNPLACRLREATMRRDDRKTRERMSEEFARLAGG